MTECTQSRLPFANHGSREVVAEFSGGRMTSDSGALLLRETDQRMNLLPRFSQCFLDGRNPAWVQHPVEQMLAQRIYSLALGYEDLNDHEQLRQDPLLKLLAGKPDLNEPLAGKSTLNRMELGDGLPNRLQEDHLLARGYRRSAGGGVLRSPHGRARADRAGHRRHRFCDTRRARRTLLSRLLRSLLLSAVICVCRRACAVRALAAQQYRSLGREPQRDRAHREEDSHGLAGSEDRVAWRCGLLPGRADGMVRSQPSGLCIRHGAQSFAGEKGGRGSGASAPAMGADPATGTSLSGVCTRNREWNLEPPSSGSG